MTQIGLLLGLMHRLCELYRPELEAGVTGVCTQCEETDTVVDRATGDWTTRQRIVLVRVGESTRE